MDNFAFTHHITVTTKTTTTTKLLGRSEDDLENELKTVKAISRNSDMNCGSITQMNKDKKLQHRRQQRDGEGRRCMDNSHLTQTKNWWIMKSN